MVVYFAQLHENVPIYETHFVFVKWLLTKLFRQLVSVAQEQNKPTYCQWQAPDSNWSLEIGTMSPLIGFLLPFLAVPNYILYS